MKPIQSAIIAAALMGYASAQTATTVPVGYVSLGDTTGAAIPADTDFMFSIPFDRPAVYSGTVSAVDTANDVITISGTTPLGSTDYTTTPHILKLGNGTKSGLICVITANNSSTVTVSAFGGEDLTGISIGDKIQIQPAWTIATLFNGVDVPAATQLFAWTGQTAGINLGADIIYEYEALEAGKFADTNNFTDASDVVLFPGEAIVLRTPPNSDGFVGSIPTFVLSGTVPTSKSRVLLSNPDNSLGQDNYSAYVSPVPTTIGNMAFANASAGDQILLNDIPGDPLNPTINKGAAVILEYGALEPGKWADTNSFTDATNFEIPGGTALIYRVAAGVASSEVLWTSEPPFVSGLN